MRLIFVRASLAGKLTQTKNPTYREFLNLLCDKASKDLSESNLKENYLSILFHISRLYFNAKQTDQSRTPTVQFTTPFSIREMLYFLAAFQFSTSYTQVEGHLGTLLTKPLIVADPPAYCGQNSGTNEAHLLHAVTKASAI